MAWKMAGHTGFVGLAEVQSFRAKSISANVSDGAFLCKSNGTFAFISTNTDTGIKISGVFLHI